MKNYIRYGALVILLTLVGMLGIQLYCIDKLKKEPTKTEKIDNKLVNQEADYQKQASEENYIVLEIE